MRCVVSISPPLLRFRFKWGTNKVTTTKVFNFIGNCWWEKLALIKWRAPKRLEKAWAHTYTAHRNTYAMHLLCNRIHILSNAHRKRRLRGPRRSGKFQYQQQQRSPPRAEKSQYSNDDDFHSSFDQTQKKQSWHKLRKSFSADTSKGLWHLRPPHKKVNYCSQPNVWVSVNTNHRCRKWKMGIKRIKMEYRTNIFNSEHFKLIIK